MLTAGARAKQARVWAGEEARRRARLGRTRRPATLRISREVTTHWSFGGATVVGIGGKGGKPAAEGGPETLEAIAALATLFGGGEGGPVLRSNFEIANFLGDPPPVIATKNA